MNFATFRSRFPDLVDVVTDLVRIGFSKVSTSARIVVVKDRSGIVKFIQSLTGFAIELEPSVPNPIEYHFSYDPSCNEDEAFCTINNSLMELNMATQYEKLVDIVNELKDWVPSASCEPIVLKIRTSCVLDLQIVDCPLETMELQYGKGWEKGDFGKSVIVRIEDSDRYLSHRTTRNDRGPISKIKVPYDHLDADSVCAIRSVLANSLVSDQLRETRGIIKKRLRVLDEEIPDTDDGKLKFISGLFSRYTGSLEEWLEFYDNSQLITKGDSQKVLVEGVLRHYRSKCDQASQENFGRFPLIVEEIQRVSRTVINTVTRPALRNLFLYLTQTPFVLLHAFECFNGNCTGDCAFLALVKAWCTAFVERTVSCVTAHVHDQLEKFVPLIQEDFAITEERKQLKEQLKVMQKAFALLHTSRETLQRFRAP